MLTETPSTVDLSHTLMGTSVSAARSLAVWTGWTWRSVLQKAVFLLSRNPIRMKGLK